MHAKILLHLASIQDKLFIVNVIVGISSGGIK